jgi:hypothetical protein
VWPLRRASASGQAPPAPIETLAMMRIDIERSAELTRREYDVMLLLAGDVLLGPRS